MRSRIRKRSNMRGDKEEEGERMEERKMRK